MRKINKKGESGFGFNPFVSATRILLNLPAALQVRTIIRIIATIVKLKNAITLLCFLVLMFQLLPVRQLGKLLVKGQLTEEISHDCNDDCNDHFPFKKDFTLSHCQAGILFNEIIAAQYIHFADSIPIHFAGEIQTPPPNIA